MLKKISVAILIIVITLLTIISPAINSKYVMADNLYEDYDLPEGYEIIEQSKDYILLFNDEIIDIAVKDKKTGYLWKALPDETEFNLQDIVPIWQNYIKSIIAFTYTNIERDDGKIQKVYSAKDASKVNTKKINNGISLEYIFEKTQISIRVDFRLEENSLVVEIPFSGIKEEGGNGLIKVELLPFFGASDKSMDGYILIPDGCGTLMKYDSIYSRQSNLKSNKWYIYSPLKVEYELFKDLDRETKYEASLPIFGVKNNDNAFLAMITKGDACASINLEPEGYVLNINRVFFEFYYRNEYKVVLSDIKIRGVSQAKESEVIRYDPDILENDYTVRYTFINGEDANYSGMANVCRNYYIESGVLADKISGINDEVPLAIDFFMGIKEDRMLFDKYIKMTDFEQVLEMLKDLKNRGIHDLKIKLTGWMKGGYGTYPNNWPPEKALGGNKGLKKILTYAQEHDIDIYLQTDFIFAESKNKGFSKKNDVVLQKSLLQVTNENRDWFLINPATAFKWSNEFIKNMNNLGQCGVAYDRIGRFVYHDHNEKNPSTRVNTIQTWSDLLKYAKENTNGVAVEGSNIYAARNADWIYEVPTKSSGYYIGDEDVPFYQMVVHGHVLYTSEPGNLFYDLASQKLKWIEYGCMPYYELTYNDSKLLKYTNYNKLFTSTYGDWVREIEAIYKEFNSNLKGIFNRNMIGHYKIEENVYKIVYDDQLTIYINYNESPISCEGQLVNGLDYLVVQK